MSDVAQRMTGRLQVYSGDGKGKTTAALGLALRAVGAGLRVFIAQFAKGRDCSELASLRRLGIEVRPCGRPDFIRDQPTAADLDAARRGLEEARLALAGGQFDVVILDEANIAVHYGLFTVNELLAALAQRAASVEVVVTGRWAHPKLVEVADLVTEMREIKHYYHDGVPARKGIED